MKRFLLALVILAAFGLAACEHSSSGRSSATTTNSEGRTVATLEGPKASADVAGDRVEIRDDSVYVKGVCYGTVPKGARVTYLVDPGKRTLLVDNEPRTPVQTKGTP
jgi:hypothetical protein